jgi:hypothetical protein
LLASEIASALALLSTWRVSALRAGQNYCAQALALVRQLEGRPASSSTAPPLKDSARRVWPHHPVRATIRNNRRAPVASIRRDALGGSQCGRREKPRRLTVGELKAIGIDAVTMVFTVFRQQARLSNK